MSRNKIIPEKTVVEEMQSYTYQKGYGVTAVIGIGKVDADGKFIFDKDQTYSTTSILSKDFDLLLSDRPSFAPTKPKDRFREQDIWSMIDIIRAR